MLGTRFLCGGHPKVTPAGGTGDVGIVEGTVTDVSGEEGEGKVVVRVFYRAADGTVGNACVGMRVVCVDGDVSQMVIVSYVPSSFDTPIWRFDFRVLKTIVNSSSELEWRAWEGDLSYCDQGFFPRDVLDPLDVGVCEECVGVTSRLGYSFAETHAKGSDLVGRGTNRHSGSQPSWR